MKGHITLYEDGVRVGEADNLITTAGKNVVLRFLASMIPEWSGAIGVGLDGTAAAAADMRLGIQTSRVPVIMKSVDYVNQTIIFKATLDPAFVGIIYEMGLISSASTSITGSYDTKLLAVFDPTELWTVTTTGGTESTLNTASRIGGTLRYATINTVSGWIQYDIFKRVDLSGYSDVDQISFGHVSYSNRLTSLVVTFTDSGGLTSTYTQTVTTHTAGDSVAQYNIYRVPRSSFTTASGFNWSQITKMTVRTNAAANANAGVFGIGGWDFVGVIDTDNLNPDYVLVSRATTGSAIATKTIGKVMDIEYKLAFNL